MRAMDLDLLVIDLDIDLIVLRSKTTFSAFWKKDTRTEIGLHVIAPVLGGFGL